MLYVHSIVCTAKLGLSSYILEILSLKREGRFLSTCG